MPAVSAPPPTGGWNTIAPLMGMPPQFAVTLDNWVPMEGSLAMRPGWRAWATGMPGRIGGLMAYNSGANHQVFAASGTGLYDVTGPGAVAAPVTTGITSIGAQGLQVAAGGGNFLLVFNGTSAEQQFDGTTWAPWTGTGAPRLTWANQFKTRIMCGRSDVLSFWYGPPVSIGGAFIEFPLQGVCSLGGGVAGGGSWTLDGGNGPDDYFVCITTEGEMVVFKGTDPSSTTAWGLVGKWNLPRPIGNRFLHPFGGDVLVLTEGGIYAVGAIVSSGADAAILPTKAYTRLIEPSFLELVRERRDLDGWGLVGMGARGLWVLNVPWGPRDAQQIAFHASTGACGRWLGIPASCWLSSRIGDFCGDAEQGRVLRFGDDTTDGGNSISAEALTAFSPFGAAAQLKAFRLAMPVMADADIGAVQIEMALDWRAPEAQAISRGPAAPPLAPNESEAGMRWDVDDWDEGKWAGGGRAIRVWRAVRGIGQSGAIRLRVQASEASPQWFGTGVVFEVGAST
jgi:hypothetical protein